MQEIVRKLQGSTRDRQVSSSSHAELPARSPRCRNHNCCRTPNSMLRIGGWSPSACSSLADLAGLLLHTPTFQFLLGFPYALGVSRNRRRWGPRTSPHRWMWSCAPNLKTQKSSETQKHTDSEVKTRAAAFAVVGHGIFCLGAFQAAFFYNAVIGWQAGGLCQTCLRQIGHRRHL